MTKYYVHVPYGGYRDSDNFGPFPTRALAEAWMGQIYDYYAPQFGDYDMKLYKHDLEPSVRETESMEEPSMALFRKHRAEADMQREKYLYEEDVRFWARIGLTPEQASEMSLEDLGDYADKWHAEHPEGVNA
jgi:hypothetical protein